MNTNITDITNLEPTSAPLYGSRTLEITPDERNAITTSEPASFEYRTLDGHDNNPIHTTIGAAETPLLRLLTPAYDDGINIPRGGAITIDSAFGPISIPDPDGLTNPRTISNTVAQQTESVPNFLGASDWLWQWGQFIDHDLDLNEGGEEGFFIPIAETDSLYNPDFPYLPFTRVPAAEGTGTSNPRQQTNEITAFIDGSGIYGSDEDRAGFLRTFQNGSLKTTTATNNELLLPKNRANDPYPNANGFSIPEADLYLAGDARANEQLGLTANHILFVREHNRLATELSDRLAAGEAEIVEQYESFKQQFLTDNPDASEIEMQDEYLYQAARKVVGAQVQVITYNEFLPLLIGETLLEDYTGYNPAINPAVSNEFANAAYRLGHTLLNDQIHRWDEQGLQAIPLGDANDPSQAAFFNPDDIEAHGIDSLLRGLMLQEAQELDPLIVDGVRNFLFPAGTGGFDLASVNIQRGREVGLPSYVDTHEQLFGVEIETFDALPFATEVIDLFEQAYEEVGQIDLWIGGLAELSADHGGLLGPTFSFFIQDQFVRAAAGDRFFFLNDLEELEVLDEDITDTNLADVIRRNTSQAYLVQDDVFTVPYDRLLQGNESDNTLRGSGQRELINGQQGDDRLDGRNGDDILIGQLGDDRLSGGKGNDTLMGGDDQDWLVGRAGNDVLVGGNGNDVLRGNNNNDILNGVGDQWGQDDFDTLRGGRGQDTFILGDQHSVFYEGQGEVLIQDFSLEQDVIELAGSAADYQLETVGEQTSLSLSATNDVIATLDSVVSDFETGFTFV